jgi:hypothetical protein
LLYPYLDNFIQHADITLTIANTTKLSGPAHSISCTISSYSRPGAPATFSPAALSPGSTNTNLVSSLAEGFQGYAIPDCCSEPPWASSTAPPMGRVFLIPRKRRFLSRRSSLPDQASNTAL